MIRTTIQSISLALALLLWVLPAAGVTLPGRVLWVNDGDTVVVLGPGNAQYSVRLAGIDAPELGQPYGQASKDHLSRRVAGRFVVVDWDKRDRYTSLVGKVLLGDQDVCLEQVRAGLAWHYKHYQGEQTRTDRLRYARAEEEARGAERGLWADPNPIPPWEWRRGMRIPEEEPAADRPPEVRQR
jgi:endonuclease YncB( thermonuclease family)